MSVCANVYDCKSGTTNASFTCFYQEIMFELLPSWLLITTENLPWICAMFGSILVGLSGVLPLLVIPIDETKNLKQGESANVLKTLLSFAVGGLLGDVFLHSLPEIWSNDAAKNGGTPTIYSGLLILSGLLTFVAAEKLFSVMQSITEKSTTTSFNSADGTEKTNNNNKSPVREKTDRNNASTNNKKHIAGYLNLCANAIDNFTHGLSLGGAFLVSIRSGIFTTFAILMHEVPHEVGDFAILLKSGFSRWDAAKYQLYTASGGLIGSLVAILCSGASNSIEARTSWILPFTAGSFLHISLVTVLPDLLKEENPWESFKQLVSLLLGIFVMAFVATIFE